MKTAGIGGASVWQRSSDLPGAKPEENTKKDPFRAETPEESGGCKCLKMRGNSSSKWKPGLDSDRIGQYNCNSVFAYIGYTEVTHEHLV